MTEEIFGENGAERFIDVSPKFDEHGSLTPESASVIIFQAEKNAKDSDAWPEVCRNKFIRLANKLKPYANLMPSN